MPPAPDSIAARHAAAEIVRILRDAGHTAYFAGGCVRDELLGLTPTDYDVATDAVPGRICSLFPRTAEVGVSFGVVLVKLDHAVVEVATFRSDGTYSDQRRPDTVTFSDPIKDAQRRDFTVNALFLDPFGEPDPAIPGIGGKGGGRIIDHVGGMADLGRRVLRAVGEADQRLAEDHLRALRAVRLAARLGFSIDPATAEAIRRHARDLKGVSRERIGDELRRIAAHPSRAAAAILLHDLGLDEPVFVLEQPAEGFAPRVLGGLPGEALFATVLAAWAVDLGLSGDEPKAGEIAVNGLVRRWRRAMALSNEERDHLRAILVGFLCLRSKEAGHGGWGELSVARQKRSVCAPWFEQSLLLVQAVDGPLAAAIAGRVGELAATPAGLCPEPLVTGDDLVAMGLVPGPAFKRILTEVYDAQLEGKVAGAAEARELARGRGV